jgi:hypothetical protein
VECASYFTPHDVRVSQCQRVSLVKFDHDDTLRSAIKPLDVTADDIRPGLTARVDLVASRVGTFPSRSPQIADQVQIETRINCVLTMRP